MGVGDISVEAGTFEAFHIKGGLGGEYYYAPEVLNIIKALGEDIEDGQQIVTLNDVHMELISCSLSKNQVQSSQQSQQQNLLFNIKNYINEKEGRKKK
jgi:hypothetical protein